MLLHGQVVEPASIGSEVQAKGGATVGYFFVTYGFHCDILPFLGSLGPCCDKHVAWRTDLGVLVLLGSWADL